MKSNSEFKILVVDDTPELLDITTRALVKEGYIVVTAKNGADCIRMIENEKPDILLLDVVLPDANGIDLSKTIKQDPNYLSLYIILISSFRTASSNISQGLESGADAYLVKPIENRELLAHVTSACRILKTERDSKDAYLKYHSLFSSIQEGVYLHEMIYNNDGVAVDYRIIEANPASEKHLDIKPEHAVGKLASELYNSPEIPNLEIYAHVTETGKSVSFEHHFLAMNKYFQISAYSVKGGRFATVFQDITSQKEASEKLKQNNEELQKINSEKDKFFSILAHDLKSPFSGFLGLTQLIEEKLSTLSKDQIQEMVISMRESATNLFRLLENLLKWAQMQKGTISFMPEKAFLYPIINEIVALEAEHAKNKQLKMQYNIPETLFVHADQNMIHTVIRNLISNAIKFTPAGGSIIISAEPTTNDMVAICIADSGIGMNTEMVSNLFRLDADTSRKGTENEPSTGLGLILCKEFIEKQRGTLKVESQVSKGSKFCFTLPAHPLSNAGSIPAEIEKPENKPGKLKILIAEDDPTSMMLLSIALKPLCKEILVKNIGTEVVETCKQNPDLDIILMDIQLPGINGYEATRRIRTFNTSVLIIAQTAFGLAGDKVKALEAGCNDYIAKPVNIEALLGMIKKYCAL